MKTQIIFILTIAAAHYDYSSAFTLLPINNNGVAAASPLSSSSPNNNSNDSYEKKNAAVDVLSNFMQKEERGGNKKSSLIDTIDFNAPKFQKVPIDTLAKILDYELTEKEWFVTGNVNPIYFSDDFEFQDPDVKLSGIENYARGVNKLFDQNTARAEIISCVASNSNIITVTWRLSGKVNIGPGLAIKPYICYTNFTVNEESCLVCFQEDEFDIPQWDVLLSSLFPFLIGMVTSSPAPPVERQDVPVMPKLPNNNSAGFLDSILGVFQQKWSNA